MSCLKKKIKCTEGREDMEYNECFPLVQLSLYQKFKSK